MPPDNPPATRRQDDAERPDKPQGGPTCSVNMTFNFTVGAVASAIGFTLIYLAWSYFFG